MRLRLLSSAAVVLLALGASACGNDEGNQLGQEVTEGLYFDVGDVNYQVQISRQLNPADVEDRDYLIGLDPVTSELDPDETWFAVFVRAQNFTDEPQPSVRDFVLEDTQGNEYRPIPLGEDNVFAYRPVDVPPKGVLPLPSSAAAEGTIQGAMLLFRLPIANLQNRPLVLRMTNPLDTQQEARAELDV
jgi:hypothetical protein